MRSKRKLFRNSPSYGGSPATIFGGLLLLLVCLPSGVQGQSRGFDASSPHHGVTYAMNVPVPMRDGVRLATDLYRPDAEGGFPVILVRTPYGSESPRLSDRGKFFARRGYVYAVQDVRGKYDSEGEWYGRRSEAEDGYDTVDWLAAQPWSTGDVGMVGASYLGLVQWQVAPLGNPHLKTLIPSVAPTTLGRSPDKYRGLAVYGRGSPALSELSWLVSTDGRVNQNAGTYDWKKLFWHLPLVEIPRTLGRDIPIWEKLVTTELGLWEVYLESAAQGKWREAIDPWPDYRERYRNVQVPILQITGWFDGSSEHSLYNRQQILLHSESRLAKDNQWIVIGPWPHRLNAATKIGALDFGGDALIDMDNLVLRWFDRWLKGVENGIDDEAPLQFFVMGRNEWRQTREWPLPNTEFTPFYFHSRGHANSLPEDGRLSTAAPRAEPPDEYRYDPGDPIPAITGGENAEMVDDGPVDVRFIEERTDVLVYTSDVLRQEIEVTGPVTVLLYVSSSAAETEFIVRLLDVYPDGASYPVWYTYANAFSTKGFEAVSDGRSAERIMKLEYELPPTSQVFAKGHRIRVHVTSAAFPLFRHLNTARNPAYETMPEVAQQTIFHDRNHPSHIILPIIPAGN